jgi:hypothetical protein
MPATCGVAGCDLLSRIAVAGRVKPAVNRAVPTFTGETAVLNQAVPAGAASAACPIRSDKDEFPHRPLFLVVAALPKSREYILEGIVQLTLVIMKSACV